MLQRRNVALRTCPARPGAEHLMQYFFREHGRWQDEQRVDVEELCDEAMLALRLDGSSAGVEADLEAVGTT